MRTFLFAILMLPAAAAFGDADAPRRAVHLLDYIAQDYRGAVVDGRIVSEEEYAEMREFSRTAATAAMETPELSRNAHVREQLGRLVQLVDDRAPADAVAKQALAIKNDIVSETHLAVAPRRWPVLADGARAYQQACAACHGAAGAGDGRVASSMQPRPANLRDDARMRAISPFQTFNTIRLGVPGTAMPAFGSLSDEESWALAFYVVSLRYPHAQSTAAPAVPLAIAASESDEQLLHRLAGSPAERQRALVATRTHSGATDSLASAMKLLREAEGEYRAGDRAGARAKALSAYLDGVEPVEPRLRAISPSLVIDVERRMLDVRAAIDSHNSAAAVAAKISDALEVLGEAQRVLHTEPSSPWFTVSVSAAIVLREAFEAILIIVAILSVVRAVGATAAARWVHAGWIAALLAGAVAWFLSDRLLLSSGLDRELLEAIASLTAVVVLLYMGFWLHRRAEITKWRAYMQQRVTSTLSSGRLAGLAAIAFFAVFREILETVLFLAALTVQSGPKGRAFTAAGVGLALLLAIGLAAAMVKFSARLPLRTMFTSTAVLMIVLSIVLAGKGVHALQESGIVAARQMSISLRADVLGIYPTVQTLSAQIAMVVVAIGLWFWAEAKARQA